MSIWTAKLDLDIFVRGDYLSHQTELSIALVPDLVGK